MSLFDRFMDLSEADHGQHTETSKAGKPKPIPLEGHSVEPAASSRPENRGTSPAVRKRLFGNLIYAVVGETDLNEDGRSRQDIIREDVYRGDPVELRWQAGSHSMAVFVHGERIGYLKPKAAERLSALIDLPSYSLEAKVDWVYDKPGDRTALGVILDIAIYTSDRPAPAPLAIQEREHA